jgi:riboflavin synthase
MFTGIIEAFAKVNDLKREGDNLIIKFECALAKELKIDQSISHNGVCLTVVSCDEKSYSVIAIKETIDKTNFSCLRAGDLVNIERAIKFGDRFDGHIVQGHVDETAKCIAAKTHDGSWIYTFKYDKKSENITIEKGSITVNGISLTVINSEENQFSVAIIPYTYENTNFKEMEIGKIVNLEFDVIGKYIHKLYLKH